MIRNWLSAAWGDLKRNPLQSIITIASLTIGLVAAILAGIVAANQMSYDHFVPGYQRLYYAVFEESGSAGSEYLRETPHDLGAYLQQNMAGIEAVTRRDDESSPVFRHGDVMAKEEFNWADPNFFRLYPVPVLYGDPNTALARPDGLVIPLAIARKYFGRGDVVGQTIELDHKHVMTVRAVIADLPVNASTVSSGIFASALASFSTMTKRAGQPGMRPNGSLTIDVVTLVRLAPGASLSALDRQATALVDKFVPRSLPYRWAMHFERVDQLHLSSRVNPDTRMRLAILGAAALAILFLAIMNFVNLSTARSAQRTVEVAIRKVSGASRVSLVAQFLSESVLQAAFALILAGMLVELLLPSVNAFLDAGAMFDYWRDPALLSVLLLGTLMVGLAAGVYPALILSAFRPAIVLKGLMGSAARDGLVRLSLVTLQFATLIGLLIAAVVVFRQNQYATTEALRVNSDQMLLVYMPDCREAFRAQIAVLPGVRGAACSSVAVQRERFFENTPAVPHHGRGNGMVDGFVSMSIVSVAPGFFELYGLSPVAGRFFRPGGSDQVPVHTAIGQSVHYVINETAARQLGYATPQAAVGQTLTFISARAALHLPPPKPGDPPDNVMLNGPIVGVVRDFSLTPSTAARFSIGTTAPIPATAYSVGEARTDVAPIPAILHVRLDGRHIPEALAGIDAAWKGSGDPDPINRIFANTYVQNLEIAVLREGQAFAAFAVVAMFLACLGLFGISLSATLRRTKEIGVRKALGATSFEIVMLLLWQFSKPVLWANVIAWPLAWWAMHRWLARFSYHVTLGLWLFPAAGAIALLIAMAAVASQAIIVARQKPVTALRYE